MRALLFDLDETLYRSAALRAARDQAIIDAVAARRGIPRGEAAAAYAAEKQGKPTVEALRSLGVPLEAFWRALASVDPRPYVPVDGSLRAMLIRLRAEHRLGILTNSPRAAADGVLAALGVRSLFDVVLGADDVPAPKPSRAAFELALERLGSMPQDTVMIGNSVEKDVLPALALGMRAIRIGPPDGRAPESLESVHHLLLAL